VPSRTTEIRHALAAAVAEIAPDARAFSAGVKYDGGGEQEFALRVLVGDPDDEATLERLDAMLDDQGEQSIKATLEKATFPFSLFVARHRGHQLFPIPGCGSVLGAEWLVRVL
jgi:hypothetical protein